MFSLWKMKDHMCVLMFHLVVQAGPPPTLPIVKQQQRMLLLQAPHGTA